jgi:hypothetical protein
MGDLGAASQVQTFYPDGTQPYFLGRLGHVSGLNWSSIIPGGSAAMSCLLGREASFRHPAMNPGRIVKIHRGGSHVWTGKLQEPTPGPGGWTIAATGNGVLGADYRCVYSTFNQNDPLDQAIGRGLPWSKASLSSSGLWLSSKPDSGSITITDYLNLITSSGGSLWQVDRYNTLTITAFPLTTATPTRLLVATNPVARTVTEDVNRLYARYQASADNTNIGATASYALVSSTVPGAAQHQEQEDYMDLTGAGVISSGTATAACSAILAKYQRANWAGPFQVGYGQYLNAGGVPVDLGCERAGEVVKLLVTDGGYGGEVSPVPIVFIAGQVAYDDSARVATITPYQSVTTDLAGMMQAVANALTPTTAA